MSTPILSTDAAYTTKVVTLTAVTEAQVLVSPSIAIPDAARQIVILGACTIIAGVTNNFQLRLRRGTGLAGVELVIPGGYTQALAGAYCSCNGFWIDQPWASGATTYTLVAFIAGADNTTTVQSASILVLSM